MSDNQSKEPQVQKKDIKLKGSIDAAGVLKLMIKGYTFDDVSDDWADGWCSAIKWSLDRIDEFFYGKAK